MLLGKATTAICSLIAQQVFAVFALFKLVP